MADFDDDENDIIEKKIPNHRIEYTDVKNEEAMVNIIKHAAEAIEANLTDKEAATILKRLLDKDELLNIIIGKGSSSDNDDKGVWQVVIGKQFVGSITYDAECLIYFQFTDICKYFMVFRS